MPEPIDATLNASKRMDDDTYRDVLRQICEADEPLTVRNVVRETEREYRDDPLLPLVRRTADAVLPRFRTQYPHRRVVTR